jgi:hypothetical protein
MMDWWTELPPPTTAGMERLDGWLRALCCKTTEAPPPAAAPREARVASSMVVQLVLFSVMRSAKNLSDMKIFPTKDRPNFLVITRKRETFLVIARKRESFLVIVRKQEIVPEMGKRNQKVPSPSD